VLDEDWSEQKGQMNLKMLEAMEPSISEQKQHNTSVCVHSPISFRISHKLSIYLFLCEQLVLLGK